MKKMFALFGIMMGLALFAWGQEAASPTLTELESLRIQNKTQSLQLIEASMQQLQVQFQSLQEKHQNTISEIDNLIDRLYLDHKLDKNLWLFDRQTMTFKKKSPTPEPAQKK